MANFMDLMQGQLSDVLIGQLTKQLGSNDTNKTSVAANGLMSILMEGLAKNASSPQGASALSGALDKNHNGNILGDVMGFLGGNAPQDKSTNGFGILRHILGGQSDNVLQNVSKMSGLDMMSVANMASKLAPIAMGLLGKQKKEQNLDASALGDFLNRSVQTQHQKAPESSIFAKILDQDGDGNIADDIAGIGMKMFSSFLKR